MEISIKTLKNHINLLLLRSPDLSRSAVLIEERELVKKLLVRL